MNAKKAFGISALCLASGLLGAIGSHGLFANDAKADLSPGVVRASRLELVDGAGNNRAVMTTTADGKMVFALYAKGKGGKPRMVFYIGEHDEPVITLNGSAGHDIIGLAVNSNDSAAINFSDKANIVRGSLGIEANGEFGVSQNNAKGNTLVSWPH